MTARGGLRGVARLAVVPFACAVVLVAAGGLPSWSTVAYGLLTATLLVGLATVPDVASVGAAFASSPDAVRSPRPYARRPRGIARVSAALLTAVVLVRAVVATTETTMRHDGRFGTTMLGAVFDEGDLATAGARVLFGTRALVDDDATTPRAMREAYARLRKERGDVVSPVVPTFAGLEPAAGGVDMVVFGPETRERPRLGVVFLHGLAGSFVLPCWVVARAFADVEASATTACPSFRVAGDWWSEDGARVLRATLAELRTQGVDRFVLVGLSNGGIGLSQLAPKLGVDARGVVGMVLVSGVDPSARGLGVPTLVFHGERDTMTSHAAAVAYAKAHDATLVSVRAGHFAMLVEEERFRAAVAAFVRRLGSARAEGEANANANAKAEANAMAWPASEDAIAPAAAEMLVREGRIRDPDAPRLVAALRAAYGEHAREAVAPDAGPRAPTRSGRAPLWSRSPRGICGPLGVRGGRRRSASLPAGPVPDSQDGIGGL